MQWITSLVIGPLGTGLAVIAVAWFGFGLLGGHFSFRRGGTLILGCFLLFTAPVLANALVSLVWSAAEVALPDSPQRIEVEPPPKPATPPTYDPYAGASFPN